VLLVGGAGIVLATLDIERFRPRIIAAVENATGRSLGFGTMQLSLGLTPSVVLRDVRLANLPGGSRPDMLTVGEAEVAIALLPLVTGRLVVNRVLLHAPDILLEEVNGAPNWLFRPRTTAQPGAAPAGPRRDTLPEIGTVAIREARLNFPGAPAGGVTVDRIDGSGHGNLALSGTLRWGQIPVTFNAEAGPLARLLGAPGPAWPLRLRAELGGARLQAEGELREPRGMSGYRFDITADLPDPAALATQLGRPLAPLGAISLRGRLLGDGTGLPRAENFTVTMGPTRLPTMLALSQVTLRIPAPDQPAQISLRGERAGQAFSIDGQIGPLAAALEGGALSMALTGEHRGITAGLRGTVAQPRVGTGARLEISLAEPALGSLRAVLAERGAFFADGLALSDIAAEGPLVVGGGSLNLGRNPRPRLEGQLTLQRLDVDAIRAVLSAPTPTQSVAPAVPTAPEAAAPARADTRVIPNLPLDFSRLTMAEADLRLAIDTLRLDGRDLRQVESYTLLADGRARIDPLALTLPGGRVTLRAAADGSQPLPQMQVSARGDALDIAALLQGFGITPPLSGRGEIDLDLRGQGVDTRAWAASSIGHIGLALTDGRVQQRLLAGLLPRDAQGQPGEVGIACFAARFDVVAGIAQARALYADGGLGRINGQGQISLRDESLALRLNTDLRLQIPGTSGLRVRAPVPVTGVLGAPRFESSGLLGQGLNQVIGNANAGTGPITLECGGALTMARGGRPGPVPGSLAPPDPPANAPRPGLQDLFRGLLGR
jgi:AsmA protein